MKLYGGIDLHSNNSVVAITDERDEVLYRKRLPNDLDTILSVLEPYRGALEGLVVESTYNWYWLVDGLMDAGYRMHLANTAAIKQYEGLKYSDDDTDACWLAKLLRKRSQLVRQHTANLLSVQNLMARNRGASISANAVKRLDFDQVGRLLENEPLVLAAAGTLVVMRSQQEMIALVEKVARRHVKHSPAYEAFKRLCTVNGIGEVLGLTILLETGDSSGWENMFPIVVA